MTEEVKRRRIKKISATEHLAGPRGPEAETRGDSASARATITHLPIIGINEVRDARCMNIRPIGLEQDCIDPSTTVVLRNPESTMPGPSTATGKFSGNNAPSIPRPRGSPRRLKVSQTPRISNSSSFFLLSSFSPFLFNLLLLKGSLSQLIMGSTSEFPHIKEIRTFVIDGVGSGGDYHNVCECSCIVESEWKSL